MEYLRNDFFIKVWAKTTTKRNNTRKQQLCVRSEVFLYLCYDEVCAEVDAVLLEVVGDGEHRREHLDVRREALWLDRVREPERDDGVPVLGPRNRVGAQVDTHVADGVDVYITADGAGEEFLESE